MDVIQSANNESLEESKTMLDDLNIRFEKYLSVLKTAEAEGNSSKVRRYKRIVKQYKDAIALCKSGRPIPLDELPNPPGFEPLIKNTLEVSDTGEFLIPEISPSPQNLDVSPNFKSRMPHSPLPSHKNISKNELPSDFSTDESDPNQNMAVPIFINDKSLEEVAVESPQEINILEELNMRLNVYKSVLKTAEDEGNASKARRYKRIIKQYMDAITLQNAGKNASLEELPSPPGFPPLVPIKSESSSPLPSRSGSFVMEDGKEENLTSTDSALDNINQPSTSNVNNLVVQPTRVTRAEKQTATLKERQKEYRNAALAAKKQGQIDQAKEYLKLCKGFDRLIQASESGLPVDLSTLPVSLKKKKEIEENLEDFSTPEVEMSTNSEIYINLEKELMDQIKMCMNTRNHFKMNGDIAKANYFEQYALQFKKDLNYVKVSRSRNHPIPKFHYENKTFSMIQSNTDLTDTELELTIMQGINYKVSNPNDVDTYVMYEFPYPSSNPPSGRTTTVKNTNNPIYNTRVVFPINKEASACQRVFKRHGIKMEVWSKGGFFHRDSSLGTVVVKLMPLAKEIKIHEAFDLMNGRRPAGGKLEVKIRIRDPLAGKKIETVSEKWLIIDYN